MSSASHSGSMGGDGVRPDPAAYAVLVEAAIAGDASDEQLAALRDILRADPTARDAYLEQLRAHALLTWKSGRAAIALPAGEPMRITGAATRPNEPLRIGRPFGQVRHWRWPAAAALVLLAATVALVIARRSGSDGRTGQQSTVVEPVADVAEMRDVVWATGQTPLAASAALPAGEIALASGSLRLNTRADAVVTITGPARVRLVSAARVQALSGRITARVGPAGKGFAVDAPGADVVDLGTEFGVQVGPAGETSVVVFEGAVDLTEKAGPTRPTSPPTQPAATTRLTRGQAVRLSPGGAAERIVAVERPAAGGDWRVDGPAGPDAVIAAVRDNLRDPALSPMYYQIARRGFAEDVRAYVDRVYEWNGIDAAGLPPELIGADLVMPFNADKRTPDLALTIVLARPAMLYILHEPRHGEVPDWLKRDFVDTGMKVGLDEGPPDMPQRSLGQGPGQSIDRIFSVWRREVRTAGPVVLGENSPSSKSMYGVAAVPLK